MCDVWIVRVEAVTDLRPALRASVVMETARNVGVVAACLAHDMSADAAEERARNIVQAIVLGEAPFDSAHSALRALHPARACVLATQIADAWSNR